MGFSRSAGAFGVGQARALAQGLRAGIGEVVQVDGLGEKLSGSQKHQLLMSLGCILGGEYDHALVGLLDQEALKDARAWDVR
jgi:hypothetical protein